MFPTRTAKQPNIGNINSYNGTVVIDQGSHSMKVGVITSGMQNLVPTPKLVLSIAGRPKYQTCMLAARLPPDRYFAEETQIRHPPLTIISPFTNGYITDFECLEGIWYHTFYRELKCETDYSFVFLTEPILQPKVARERTVQIMIETFNFDGIMICNQQNLALVPLEISDAIILDSGHQITTITPIYNHCVTPHLVKRLAIGGVNLSNALKEYLLKNDHLELFHNKNTVDSLITEIKEMLCSANFESKQDLPQDDVSFYAKNKRFSKSDLAHLGDVLFQYDKDNISIPSALAEVLAECSDLKDKVYMIGGNSCLQGFHERLIHETNKLLDESFQILKPNTNLKTLSWMGASKLATLKSSSSIQLSREEYDEYGPTAIHKYCV